MIKVLILFFVSITSVGFGEDNGIADTTQIPSFEGYVGAPTSETDNLFKRFNDFMLDNEKNVIYLDITMDTDQHEAFKTSTDDFYFFAVYDDYPDKLSGNEYHFLKSKTPASYSFNTDTNVVEGYFRITEITGPQNGLFVVNLVPVKKVLK